MKLKTDFRLIIRTLSMLKPIFSAYQNNTELEFSVYKVHNESVCGRAVLHKGKDLIIIPIIKPNNFNDKWIINACF
jgi:hypothetical protein